MTTGSSPQAPPTFQRTGLNSTPSTPKQLLPATLAVRSWHDSPANFLYLLLYIEKTVRQTRSARYNSVEEIHSLDQIWRGEEE